MLENQNQKQTCKNKKSPHLKIKELKNLPFLSRRESWFICFVVSSNSPKTASIKVTVIHHYISVVVSSFSLKFILNLTISFTVAPLSKALEKKKCTFYFCNIFIFSISGVIVSSKKLLVVIITLEKKV